MGHRRNRKRDRRNIAAYKEFTPEALPDLDWSAVLPRRAMTWKATVGDLSAMTNYRAPHRWSY